MLTELRPVVAPVTVACHLNERDLQWWLATVCLEGIVALRNM